VEWVARHVLEISGHADQVLHQLYEAKIGSVQVAPRASCDRYPTLTTVLRPEVNNSSFARSPDRSLRTGIRLSAAWHEAVANVMAGPNYEFPCLAWKCVFLLHSQRTHCDTGIIKAWRERLDGPTPTPMH
jgi:hypothetical protein